MRPVQYFSDDYLRNCRQASSEQILEFLENYRLLQAPPDKTRLISIKMPERLLQSFRIKCELHGIRYQTRIKQLMLEWLQRNS